MLAKIAAIRSQNEFLEVADIFVVHGLRGW
jgi:hypothetical protein